MSRRIKTINKMVRIIEEIKKENGRSIIELSDELGLSASTIHAYVKTLENHRFLTKEGNQYQIGLRFLPYGEYARKRQPEYKYIESIVDELSEESQEGADFCVAEAGKIYAIYNSISSAEDPAFNVGRSFYMHNSATGKAILAEYSKKRVRKIIDRWDSPKETEDTIVNPDELHQELDEIRERGYAFTKEEVLPGLQGVGAAVKRPDSTIVGALSVGGPSYRVHGEKLHDELSKILMSKVNKLEEKIEAHYR